MSANVQKSNISKQKNEDSEYSPLFIPPQNEGESWLFLFPSTWLSLSRNSRFPLRTVQIIPPPLRVGRRRVVFAGVWVVVVVVIGVAVVILPAGAGVALAREGARVERALLVVGEAEVAHLAVAAVGVVGHSGGEGLELGLDLHIASLVRDGAMLDEARSCASKVLDADPGLERPENAVLLRELRKGKYDIRNYSNIS